MCLLCYPGPCSRYRCLKAPPLAAFVCDACERPAIVGDYDAINSITTIDGDRLCGSCVDALKE